MRYRACSAVPDATLVSAQAASVLSSLPNSGESRRTSEGTTPEPMVSSIGGSFSESSLRTTPTAGSS